MLKVFLWLRYLRKKRIVFLSIAAVALSAALLIIVSSLFNGFIRAFEQSAVDAIGDVVIAPPMRFAKYEELIEQLEKSGAVEAATATLSAPALLHLGRGNVRAVAAWGIEPQRRTAVTGFKKFLLKQGKSSQQTSFKISDSPEKGGGFVGIGVIAEPDEKTDEYNLADIEKMIGQEVVLTTGVVSKAQESEGTAGQVKRKAIKFTVADIVFTGVYYVDKTFIYLPIEELQKTLYPDDGKVADQIQIKLIPGAGVEESLARIRLEWRKFAAEQLGWTPYLIEQTTIITSKQMQSRYVAEIRKQMGVLLLIFGIVSLSVVMLIFCIFYMIVMSRQKDIAIIKSCGARSSSAASIFAGFGACVGAVGSVFGVILAVIVTKNINTVEEWIRIIFGLKLWKSSTYMFSRIPSEVDWAWAVPIALFAVAAAVIGALIPAIIAARTRPVNILRYE